MNSSSKIKIYSYRISANFRGFKTVITPEKIYLKDINKQLKNYIAIFDYNGNYVRTIDLSSKIKNTELEELCFYNGVFYIAGTNWINNSFSIFKLNIKNSNKFDISYLDLATKYNEYQTVTIGTEKILLRF